MRGALVLAAAFIAMALSGCLGGSPVMFAQWRLPDGSPAPVFVDDCAELLDTLNDRAIRETDTLIDQSLERGGRARHWGFAGDDVVMMESADSDGAAADAAGTAPAARDAEVTGTNNQEAGVDEADLLKTDGEWTYVLQGDTLYILHSATVGSISEHARMRFADERGGQLLLERRAPDDASDDRLIVITDSWRKDTHPEWGPYYGTSETRVRVLELGDRSDPQVVKDLSIEGAKVAARLVDGHAYTVTHTRNDELPLRTDTYVNNDEREKRGLDWNDYRDLPETEKRIIQSEIALEARAHNRATIADASLADHLPRIREHRGEATVTRAINDAACQRFLTADGSTGRSVSTIMSIHVGSDDVPDRATQALGSHPIVYGATDAIVLAAASRDAWWFWDNPRIDEATDLQWFDLDGLDVTPRASGRVPGIVRDSFAIDVHADTLRVATTTGQWNRWWIVDEEREPMMNHIVILRSDAGALVPTGLVGGIAPDERIWSARFTDDRAYIITFEQIDPLWIIDLSDPTRPRILGELEIPGVSTYIHPISKDLLLTIGYGPRDNGRGLDFSRYQVSLFDSSDESRPRRAALLELSPDEGWSRSGAAREHKAFTYWDRIGTLAVPLSTSVYLDGHTDHHVGLKLIDVDKQHKTLRLHGEVDHDHLISTDGWYGGFDIQRSYFLGVPDDAIVSVYAMSPFGLTAHDLSSLERQDQVRFDLPEHHGHGFVID